MDDRNRCHCGYASHTRLFRARLTGDRGWIVRCRYCGQVRTFPFPYETAHDVAAAYAGANWDLYEANRADYSSWARLLLEEMTDFGKPGRLLDVGCGPGLMVSYARGVGIDAWGIDINDNDVRFADAQGLGQWVSRLEVTQVRDSLGLFDSALLNHVLEHVTDPVGFLRTLTLCLEPGALVAVAVPDFSSINRIVLRQLWYGLQPDTHPFHFEKHSLAGVLRRGGLDPLRISSKTTVGTTYHTHRPRSFSRRLYGKIVLPIAERIGRTDQLLAICRVSTRHEELLTAAREGTSGVVETSDGDSLMSR